MGNCNAGERVYLCLPSLAAYAVQRQLLNVFLAVSMPWLMLLDESKCTGNTNLKAYVSL